MRCKGYLKGDPDIAGTGVVAAIWVTNGASVAAGLLLWWLTVVQKRKPSADKTCKRILTCAFALSDTALVTMLALVSSSIILIKSEPDTSLYHVFIARCLAENCQAGLFSSVPYYVYRQSKTRHLYGTLARMILYACTVFLWLYWTTLCLSEFEKWGRRTPSCFFNDNIVEWEYTTFMKLDLFWTPSANIWYLLEVWDKYEGFLQRTNDFVRKFPTRVEEYWNLCHLGKSTKSNSVIGLALHLLTICAFVPLLIVDILACLVNAIFISPPLTAPWIDLAGWVWSVYDVLTVWRSNKHIVVGFIPGKENFSLQGNMNPEFDWGFGQLLPLFLLILPILAVIDSIDE